MKPLLRPPFWRRILRAAGLRAFHFADNNNDARAARNGEVWLFRQLICSHRRATGSEPMVIFDIGANVGDYTRSALREARRSNQAIQVHAFEPSTYNIDILQHTFAHDSNVSIAGVAVADQPGKSILYSHKPGSTQASLTKRITLSVSEAEASSEVPVIRLDDYMSAQQVKRVDVLKVDVEGAELAVLRGLGAQLNPEIVRLIQFEYGGTALDAGTTLRDFYSLLSQRGYVIAKLLPRALEVRTYHPWMEHYAYANYVAFAPELMRSHKPTV